MRIRVSVRARARVRVRVSLLEMVAGSGAAHDRVGVVLHVDA